MGEKTKNAIVWALLALMVVSSMACVAKTAVVCAAAASDLERAGHCAVAFVGLYAIWCAGSIAAHIVRRI